MRIPRLPFSEILHITEVLAIIGATIFAGIQVRELRLQTAATQLQNSADLTLRLGQELATGINQKLEDALDSDPATPILKQKGGKFTVEQLDGYLGEYETLDDLYRNGLIACSMMYNEFSYDLENAYKNKDVLAEVAEERKDDPSIWQGFLDLGRQFDKTTTVDNKTTFGRLYNRNVPYHATLNLRPPHVRAIKGSDAVGHHPY